MNRCAWILVLVLTATLNGQTAPSAPETVREFYSAYQKLKISGLPDEITAQKLKSYLSPQLQTAMNRARAEQSRCLKAHPDDKGPWVEGDMFSSNFEGFTSVRVEDPKASDAVRQTLTLNFEYADGGQKVTWSDQVVVIKQNGRWLIDDVIYRRQSGFGNGFGTSIRRSLTGKGC